jgi:hypothetical protein
MFSLKRFMVVLACLSLPLAMLPARAQTSASTSATISGPVKLSSQLQYQWLGRWDQTRLNTILTVDIPKFSGVTQSYTPARNAVNLYRVTYTSVVPERGNRPVTTTGLVAVPDTADTALPMVSYQHGTVYGKQQVPSFPEQSDETQLMIAQFAGQGYIVIGADYFGMGDTKEPEGYMVKQSHQQATYDMLVASQSVLQQLKRSSTKLFLSGWSQGGFVTMAMLEKLEGMGYKVQAAATASAPVDVFLALNGALLFPRKIDAPWMTTTVILTAFAYENYYGVPGLARSLINDDVYEVSRKLYTREPVNAADVPTDLKKLVRPAYFDAQFFAESAYGRLLADKGNAYRWVVKTPVRNYYGDVDEAITVGVGQMAMHYQQAMGNGNPKVEAISTGPTTHRGTYARAAAQWKQWFDTQ